MEVDIRTAAADSLSSGKTSGARFIQVAMEPHYDHKQRLAWLAITGETKETRGTGGRGGTATTYTKEIKVCLLQSEIRQIAAEAVKGGVYVPPGKEELLAAYNQLAESERQVAATRRALAAVLSVQGVSLPAEGEAEVADAKPKVKARVKAGAGE